MQIRFGTDGWRAIIADEFTFANVEIIAQALADYIFSTGNASRGIVIGYDYRFHSENYALRVAEVVASNHIPVYLSDTALPTPALSLATKQRQCAGGIMITASHNPPLYNGIKFKAPYGGSATKEITQAIEKKLYQTLPRREPKIAQRYIQKTDLVTPYLTQLQSFVVLEKIIEYPIKVVADSMHGVGKNYLEQLLQGGKIQVKTIRGNRDALFGGILPEPIPKNLGMLFEEVQRFGATVGLATDGDSDRIGVVDEQGRFVTPHHLAPILFEHLKKTRKWSGDVVRTISMASIIDKLAAEYGATVTEVPVGFKNVAELMVQKDILIGGEESGGIGIKNHIPERDGLLLGLLTLECLVTTGKKPSNLVADLESRFGKLVYDRIDAHCPDEIRIGLINRLKSQPPDKIANITVDNISSFDGIKFYLVDGSWLLIRASDTEPVVRIYVGSDSERKTASILNAGKILCGIK
ncbi:MAG: phosphoglucomutase/phosphomannomutase family protein [bacterium]|nr:phosphoglucomutase/phosphomannomutase family protein [bacterium]